MFTADHMALESSFIDLSPSWVQSGENFILTLPSKRLHAIESELIDPGPICQNVMHALVEHRHSDGRIFHEHAQNAFHIDGWSIRIVDTICTPAVAGGGNISWIYHVSESG
ncbi:MAG: hypothetical protein ABL974_03615 [Prosthecobacter sp.]